MSVFIEFNKAFSDIAATFAFSHRGNYYYRLAGDVLQVFCLAKQNCGHAWTIMFGLIPLAYGINSKIPPLHDYSWLLESDDWGNGIPKEGKTDKEIALLLVEEFRNRLAPVFSASTDCSNALNHLIAYERESDAARRSSFRNKYGKEAACGIVPNYYEPYKYYLALKAHNYVVATKCAHAQLDSVRMAKSQNEEFATDEKRIRYANAENFWCEQLRLLNNNQVDSLQKLVEKNEQESKLYIEKVFGLKND